MPGRYREGIQRAVRIVGEIRGQLQYYDYLLPGDYVPEPRWVKRWFRWRPAFKVTDDMLIWAGMIARARSLMDLKSAEEAIASAQPQGNHSSARKGLKG